ncbi:MAG TPA: hypothetical protein VFE36_09095 [Candidatus Baltobacteraceae bacterium]|nr:hypothetical protein [Candidatus Baltobacteraceae bacterium]
MYVQPLDGQLGPATLAPLETATESVLSPAQSALTEPLGGEDGISRFVPPGISNAMLQNPMQTALFGPLGGLMQQLMQMLQSMMGYGGNGASNGYGGYPGGCDGYGNEQYFSNASGASTGDPHLSFNGNHWDSMSSQPDLLESNSIPGGFQVSTQVTQPNARGVTWNQSATVALDNGNVAVSMNNEGQATLQEGNRTIPLAAGQSLNLGNGASVTCNANGSLSVLAQNGNGGRIETTLTAQGQGVNVETNAQNVNLGGALVTGTQQQSPIGGPVLAPQPPLDPWQPIVQSPIGVPGGGPITAPGNFPLSPQPIHMTPY